MASAWSRWPRSSSRTTLAGRALVLCYERTAYHTFTDETGEAVEDPVETKITATLDGAPIDGHAVSWSSDTAPVRSDDLGRFTATNTDYAADHSEALRRYLKHRPSDEWEVAIVDKAGRRRVVVRGDDHERPHHGVPESRLSRQVMRTLARGADAPTDARVARYIAHDVRGHVGEDH